MLFGARQMVKFLALMQKKTTKNLLLSVVGDIVNCYCDFIMYLSVTFEFLTRSQIALKCLYLKPISIIFNP